MHPFTLIDLDSQADAVARHIQSWKLQNVLNWMSQYGEVTKVNHPMDDRLYIFCSTSGIKTGFRFTENDELIIVREHSMYRPRFYRAK